MVTIKDILLIDYCVDKIEVTVRDEDTAKYIMQYVIGKEVRPGKAQRFLYETELGDVHGTSGMKTLFMNRTIQYRQLEKKAQGKEMCVGVLLEEIPEEILMLPVMLMNPYDCGWSHDLHGIRFECYVDTWYGIPGEENQIELEWEE